MKFYSIIRIYDHFYFILKEAGVGTGDHNVMSIPAGSPLKGKGSILTDKPLTLHSSGYMYLMDPTPHHFLLWKDLT